MSDFVLWVRRVSLAVAFVALAAGASWADEPYQDVADDAIEAPQIEDQHQGADDPAPNPQMGLDDSPWIKEKPVIDVDDQGHPLVTPEPATLALLTAGAAGTVIARRRKGGR